MFYVSNAQYSELCLFSSLICFSKHCIKLNCKVTNMNSTPCGMDTFLSPFAFIFPLETCPFCSGLNLYSLQSGSFTNKLTECKLNYNGAHWWLDALYSLLNIYKLLLNQFNLILLSVKMKNKASFSFIFSLQYHLDLFNHFSPIIRFYVYIFHPIIFAEIV